MDDSTRKPSDDRAIASHLLATNPAAWLAAIVDSSDDGIIGKTLDSVIRSWNAGATRIFGFQPSEIIGQSVLRIIPPELRFEEPQIIARLTRGERVDHYETVRLRKDGTRLDVSLSVSPIRDQTGRIIGAAKVVRDITEARRLQRAERELVEQLQQLAGELEQQVDEGQSLQEELEQTNDELTRSLADAQAARRLAEEANAAKSQFLAMMSHELRTPLNAIVGYLELLELGIRGPINDDQREDLARIRRSEETLHRLIEDVLSFAKLESGKLEFHYEDVRLGELLAALEPFMAPRLAQKGLAYHLHTDCAEDVVSIDRAKVEQILLNLLSNAVKFTEHGGIDVLCRVDDSRIVIQVKDTGRGVPPELLDTIFEPFVQGERSLTRSSEGTGLGLSISRQLANGLGGDVTVRSTVGQGSVFTLSLPRNGSAARG